MATVLVVDDSPVEQQRTAGLLARPPDDPGPFGRLTVAHAAGGEEALAAIAREAPEVVVTDLRMPGMNGLELVEAIKRRHPSLPVILMTAFGSEEVALRALQSGAAGYVPKRKLASDLLQAVEEVLETVRAARGHRRVLECQSCLEAHFTLDNDPGLVAHLVGHLRGMLAEAGLLGENERIRLSVALREALINAVNHGNLEVSSALLEDSDTAYADLLELRRRQDPYRRRRVHVTARQTPAEVVYVIRDEGPGFDPSRLPDPRDPANIEKASGRGLLLIRSFVDEVRHNEKGNEITLLKRCRPL
jgi:CheY-like chemotaxis protein/anti-sigma regulatory factor (Ser/Thr protein kinase)